MRKRFRWTKRSYRTARSLARFFGGRAFLPDEMPDLLRRYYELCERNPQYDDPLAGERWERMWHLRSKHGPDDIPF